MSHWQLIRKIAREKHEIACLQSNGNISAQALIEAAAQVTQIFFDPVREGDPLLDGGIAAFDAEAEYIWYKDTLNPSDLYYCLAHEYAHVWQHGNQISYTISQIEMEVYDESLPSPVQRVEGYNPLERSERDCNIFAREFLLPRDKLFKWYLEEGQDAQTIANKLGLSKNLVLQELSHALLTYELTILEDEPVFSATEVVLLDEDQNAAVLVEQGPVLLDAGPGTGKTRTLIARLKFLVEQIRVDPTKILTLTFSNKAAEEMRTRISITSPEVASQIWMGTFHAFGFEILCKYGSYLGLLEAVSIIDKVDAILLLERFLPDLHLIHYQNLYDPAKYLPAILSAISRAKDEMISPEIYQHHAENMRNAASTEEEIQTAEKALEVARIYKFYQALLQEKNLLDFGDLIYRAVHLLQNNPVLCDQIQQNYLHILVDEYQDVNRATSLLLQAIAGDGKGLWVVGDARQSIYRFRGAAPRNMGLFSEDFPGAMHLQLRYNYRSHKPLTDLFSNVASTMTVKGGKDFEGWKARRTDPFGDIDMIVALDEKAEIVGLANKIMNNRTQGISYRDQAILCRTHSTLARIATQLQQYGVPVLYLGDLFAREEVKDLLALISFVCEGNGNGLVRVSTFAEYQIPLKDVQRLLNLAQEAQKPFPSALNLGLTDVTISPSSQKSIACLIQHLDGISYSTNAWYFLLEYLFQRSNFLEPLLRVQSAEMQQRRLAVFQLLQFAFEKRHLETNVHEDSKRAFLRYIRRLEQYKEDRYLREVPEWATAIDAIQLLTVHASKGLEFRAVFLPNLKSGYFPLSRQGNLCPLPPSLANEDAKQSHDEEEECLFFVALSRARDVLCLSRPAHTYTRRGRQRSNPSSLLLSGFFTPLVAGNIGWTENALDASGENMSNTIFSNSESPDAFDASKLETYEKCPKRYFFEHVLLLKRKREEDGYIQFHRCVYEALRGLSNSPSPISEEDGILYLKKHWQTHGPTGHLYEPIYWEAAELMIRQVYKRGLLGDSHSLQREVELSTDNGKVKVTLDLVGRSPQGVTKIQRFRTGRHRDKEIEEKPIYGLYAAAAQELFPNETVEIEIFYLATGEVNPVEMTPRVIQNKVNKYSESIRGIIAGEFPAKVNSEVCPRCPFYFICDGKT